MLPPHTINPVIPDRYPFRIDHAATGELCAAHTLFPDLDHLGVSCTEQHRLEDRWTFAALEKPLIRVGIFTSNKATQRLVHDVVANDVRQFVDAQRNLFDGTNIVPLELVLYRFPLYLHCGREVIAAKKEREHRRCDQFRSVGRPDHAWEWITLELMDQGRTSFLKFCHIHPNGLKGL